jgi:hypothetical protein
MDAGDLIKWGLIGLAGWWVYETFFGTAAALYTVKTLPTGQKIGTQATITDGQNATDCTVGGGSTQLVCEMATSGIWTPASIIAGQLATLNLSALPGAGTLPVTTPPIQIPTPVVAAPISTSSSAVTNASGFSSLASLYNAMLAAAQAANDPAVFSKDGVSSATGYVWNYYLQKVAPNVAGASLSASTGNTTYTSAAYWALVEPAVSAQLGLSGYGRGLAGLAAVIMRGRR